MLKLEPGELWHWTSNDKRHSSLYVVIGDDYDSTYTHRIVCLVSELDNGIVVNRSVRTLNGAWFINDGLGETQRVA